MSAVITILHLSVLIVSIFFSEPTRPNEKKLQIKKFSNDLQDIDLCPYLCVYWLHTNIYIYIYIKTSLHVIIYKKCVQKRPMTFFLYKNRYFIVYYDNLSISVLNTLILHLPVDIIIFKDISMAEESMLIIWMQFLLQFWWIVSVMDKNCF